MLLSPLIVGLLTSPLQKGDTGFGIMAIVVFGIPVIAIVGLIGLVLSKKQKDARTMSLVSFAAPAALICIIMLYVVFASR